MTVYGVSYAEAEQQIRILMQLSTANIMNLTGGEGITDIPTRRKLPTLVYPVYAKLMEGDITTSGQWRSNKRKTTRIVLSKCFISLEVLAVMLKILLMKL